MEVGTQAPPLVLEASDGRRFSLADRAGRPLVLYFYPKDDTSGCTREAQDFTASAADFAAVDADILGVSRDDTAKHGMFIAKYELGVSLASDDGSLSEGFGTWVEKSMYGRKYMGMERATFLIDGTGRVARAWRKVKVPGHAAEVLAAVRGLA